MKAPRLRGCFLYKNRYRRYAGQPVKTQPPRRAVFPQGGWWSGTDGLMVFRLCKRSGINWRTHIKNESGGKLRLHRHFGLFFYALGVDVE